MGKYCVTMEAVMSIAKWFEAENDEAAQEQAEQMLENTSLQEFAEGCVETDYALDAEDGRTVVSWS